MKEIKPQTKNYFSEVAVIIYRTLNEEDAIKLQEIDRSEHIDLVFEMNNETLNEIHTKYDCPNWDNHLLEEIQTRFTYEISQGGYSIGAFDRERLVGFGVLAHKVRGSEQNQLQID